MAVQLDVTGQNIYNWPHQDLIGRGCRPGLTTAELVELSAARRRNHEPETELVVAKRALDLLRQQTDPRGALVSSSRS